VGSNPSGRAIFQRMTAYKTKPHPVNRVGAFIVLLLIAPAGVPRVLTNPRSCWLSCASFFDFEDGAVATAVINGYDHYDSRLLVYGPDSVDPAQHASARKELRESLVGDSEAKAAAAERYGGERAGDAVRPQSTLGGGWIMGGPTVISFDHADVSFSLKGLEVFTDDSRYEIDLTGPEDGRDARLNSYYEAIVNGAPLPADGRWGLGTLEVLLAIERSSEARADVLLEHQGPSVD
jgi:phthalate 4,5-cis-dihydrodiol dehydrogenase